MIQLSRLNRQPIVVNSDAIKFVESSPDTTITLMNGEKLLVRETPAEVVERIVHYRRLILAGLSPESVAQALCAYADSAHMDGGLEWGRPGRG